MYTDDFKAPVGAMLPGCTGRSLFPAFWDPLLARPCATVKK